MTPFAGCVVAFETDSFSFYDSYSFYSAPNVKFATISNMTSVCNGDGKTSREDLTGYLLIEFVKNRSAPMHRLIIKEDFTEHSFSMRVATLEELEQLENAVSSATAFHPNVDWKKVRELAEKYFYLLR